jgi:hypothetical protein
VRALGSLLLFDFSDPPQRGGKPRGLLRESRQSEERYDAGEEITQSFHFRLLRVLFVALA